MQSNLVSTNTLRHYSLEVTRAQMSALPPRPPPEVSRAAFAAKAKRDENKERRQARVLRQYDDRIPRPKHGECRHERT